MIKISYNGFLCDYGTKLCEFVIENVFWEIKIKKVLLIHFNPNTHKHIHTHQQTRIVSAVTIAKYKSGRN